MNRILTILLIASTFYLPVLAKRSSRDGKEGTREASVPTSGTLGNVVPQAQPATPAPTYHATPSTRTTSVPFATPTTTRSYTPTTPSYRGEVFKGRSEQSPSQSQRQTTRVATPTGPSSTVRNGTTVPPPTTPAPSVSAESVRREEIRRVAITRERNESRTQPVHANTTPSEETRTTFRAREHKEPLREPTVAGTTPQEENRSTLSTRERKNSLRESTLTETGQRNPAPSGRNSRSRQESTLEPTTPRDVRVETPPQRETERFQRERTTRTEQPQRVQITPPARTPMRTTVKESSPLIVSERFPSHQEPEKRISSSRQDRPQYNLNTQRRPEPVRTTYHPPDTHNYHSRQYPTHHYNSYRPVTCYSGRDAFWNAFSFAMVAPLVAPLYIAHSFDPFPVRTVTTTWNSGNVAVSVSSHSSHPAYTYRPYYCSSTWGQHDGWQHSNVYYGGWRSSWYGGFSYMFNPYPVYRTYYLYEEPQTVVIQQPAQQVVYINQPAPQAAPAQGSVGIFEPPQQPVVAPLPAETQQVENTPAPCFCACKCNGRVPCICEYACGSEFNYSPEAYTLVDFISYSESLNAELIWSSYAELDRPEVTDFVAEAGN